MRLRLPVHLCSTIAVIYAKLLETAIPLPRLEFSPGLMIQTLEAFPFPLGLLAMRS